MCARREDVCRRRVWKSDGDIAQWTTSKVCENSANIHRCDNATKIGNRNQRNVRNWYGLKQIRFQSAISMRVLRCISSEVPVANRRIQNRTKKLQESFLFALILSDHKRRATNRELSLQVEREAR